jgi:hypothetical protein
MKNNVHLLQYFSKMHFMLYLSIWGKECCTYLILEEASCDHQLVHTWLPLTSDTQYTCNVTHIKTMLVFPACRVQQGMTISVLWFDQIYMKKKWLPSLSVVSVRFLKFLFSHNAATHEGKTQTSQKGPECRLWKNETAHVQCHTKNGTSSVHTCFWKRPDQGKIDTNWAPQPSTVATEGSTERADQSENEKRCEKENEHTDLRSKFSSNQLSKSSRTQHSGSGVTQAKTCQRVSDWQLLHELDTDIAAERSRSRARKTRK